VEWVAISFSQGSSQLSDQTRISWIGRRVLYHWATWEAHVIGPVLSPVRLTATPWTIGRQASLSMGISQARILDWVAMPSSRGSSQSRVQTQVSRIAGGFFTVWATREAHMIGPRSYLRQSWVWNLVFHTLSPSWCYSIKNLWIVLHPSMQWGRGKREPHLQETAKSTPAPSCALKMNQTRWCKLVCHLSMAFLLTRKLIKKIVCCTQSLSCVQLLATPWTVALQAPLAIEFSRQEYWGRLPFPPPGDLAWVFFISCIGRWIFYHWATWEAQLKNRNTTVKKLQSSSFSPRSQSYFKSFYILARVRCESVNTFAVIKGTLSHYRQRLLIHSMINMFSTKDICFILQKILIFRTHLNICTI